MQYRTYKETMLPQMVQLWKEEAVRIRYKAYDSPEEWKAELLDKADLTRGMHSGLYGFRQPGRVCSGNQPEGIPAGTKPGQYAGLYIPSGGKRGI